MRIEPRGLILGDMTSRAEKIIRTSLPNLLPRLWRYALVLTRNNPAAEALVEDTVKAAFQDADKYQSSKPFEGWVLGLMNSCWAKVLRARKGRKGAPLRIDLPETSGPPEIARQLNLIMDLPLGQRIPVYLVYVEGYRYAQVADQLGVPVGVVMSRLAASRKTVRALMSNRMKLEFGS